MAAGLDLCWPEADDRTDLPVGEPLLHPQNEDLTVDLVEPVQTVLKLRNGLSRRTVLIGFPLRLREAVLGFLHELRPEPSRRPSRPDPTRRRARAVPRSAMATPRDDKFVIYSI
jgi:hypothetical protein